MLFVEIYKKLVEYHSAVETASTQTKSQQRGTKE